MNKTMKRILALILTLCTVFGLMVPVVFAEETANTTNTFFDFTTTGGEKGVKWDIIRNATNKEIGSDNFVLNENGIQVKFGIAWDTCDPLLTIDGTTVKGQFGRWFAIELKEVPAGTYDATFALSSISNGGYAKLFIVDSAEYKLQDAKYFPNGDAGLTLDTSNEMFSNLNFIKEVKYDSCYSTYGGYSAREEIGEVTFEKTGDYVLIFQCYGRSTGNHPQFSTKSLTLTPVETSSDEAKIGETAYAKIEEAITNAKSGDEIVLQAECDMDAITISDGVTLDLNGYKLTADSVSCFGTGSVVDTSEASSGVLKVASGSLSLQSTNPQMPLYAKDAEGYRFFEISVNSRKSVDGDNVAKFYFALNCSEEAAKVIAAGESGLTLSAMLDWGASSQNVTFGEDNTFIQQWADAVVKNPGKTVSMVLTVTGVDAVDSISLTPAVSTSFNVGATGNELPWNKA